MIAIPRWLRISGFVAYALVVVTATHWPKLQIESDVIERPDILIHIAVFGGWAIALLESTLLRIQNIRRRAVTAWLVSAAYAGLDEVTQQLPGVYRTACWDDYGANVTGITLACITWWLVQRSLASRRSLTPSQTEGAGESVR